MKIGIAQIRAGQVDLGEMGFGKNRIRKKGSAEIEIS